MTRLAKHTRPTEYKPVVTQVKAVSEPRGILEGYLNVKHVEDLGGDVTHDGCFKKTLQDSRNRMRSQSLQGLWPFLYNHSYEHPPVGLIVDAEEDRKGLWIQAKCFMDTERGREVYSAYAQGGLNAFSMGYKAHQISWGKKADGSPLRNLLEVQIMEASSVVFPMNIDSTVTAIKGRQDYNMLLRAKDFTSNYQSAQGSDWVDDFGDLASALQQSILELFAPGRDPEADLESDVIPQFMAALRAYVSEGVSLGYTGGPASAQGVYSGMSLADELEAKRGYLNAQTHATIQEATTNIMKSARGIHKALASLSARYNQSVGQNIYSGASAPMDFFEEKANEAEDEEDVKALIKTLTTQLALANELRENREALESTMNPMDVSTARLRRQE